MTVQVPVSSDVLKKSADYVAATQPIIEAMRDMSTKSASLAPKVVEALIKKGFLADSFRQQKIAAYIENPLAALADLHTLANTSQPAGVGGPSGTKEASFDPANESADDVFARMIMSGSTGR